MNINKQNKHVFDILNLTCIIYAIAGLIINTFMYFIFKFVYSNKVQLLNLFGMFFIFISSFIISLIVILNKKMVIKHTLIKNISVIYSIISSSIILFVYFIEDGALWTFQSMILTLLYSVVISFLLRYLTLKNNIIKYFIYYTVNTIAFLILTILIANYGEGNKKLILFFVFTIVHFIISIVYFFIRKSFNRYDNDDKTYKKQFD